MEDLDFHLEQRVANSDWEMEEIETEDNPNAEDSPAGRWPSGGSGRFGGLIMWVVYLSASYAGAWGHTYFRHEENAMKYYDKLVQDCAVSMVTIREIQTED